MSLKELSERIKNKNAVLGVIGLGYVGLPVAAMFAEAGYQVIGVERNADRVNLINDGKNPIEGREPGLEELLEQVVESERLVVTDEYSPLADADVILIAVETPVGENNIPHFEALSEALRTLGPVLREGALVIVESTIAPGTMDHLVGPLLEESTGRRLNDGFYMGHCPERVMPGKLLRNLRIISRVCGGSTPEISQVMASLYKQIVQADIDLTDCLTAELVKTAENTYRDVNIAFANELALICEAAGGDVWRVRKLVNKVPGRNVLLPGAGVGGHCLPKDPWLLVYGSKDSDLLIRLIPAARVVNNSMPQHMVDLTIEALREAGKDIIAAKILVLGYAYLENSDDDRNSPSAVLAEILKKMGADVTIHDPHIAEFKGNLQPMMKMKDAVILMVAHEEYKNIFTEILEDSVVIDGRGIWRDTQTGSNRFGYHLIGYSAK